MEPISENISDSQYDAMNEIVEILANDILEGCQIMIKAIDHNLFEQPAIRKALMGAVLARSLNKLKDMDPK